MQHDTPAESEAIRTTPPKEATMQYMILEKLADPEDNTAFYPYMRENTGDIIKTFPSTEGAKEFIAAHPDQFCVGELWIVLADSTGTVYTEMSRGVRFPLH